MFAEIITIGDELLIGQVVDTNSAWMGKELNKCGIEVLSIVSVRDREEEILEALDKALKKVDIVLMTGGLGPTKDDITKLSLCHYYHTELVFSQAVMDNVTKILAGRVPMNKLNQQQAMVPKDCTVINNRVGTASVSWFDRDGKVVVSMPGVPQEMKNVMSEEVLPRLMKRFKTDFIVHRTFVVQHYPESVLATTLASWEEALPECIKLAYLPKLGIVRLRMTARGKDKDALEKVLDDEEIRLRAILGEDILAEGDVALEVTIGNMLKEKGMTLSTAESCTGGSIAARLTSVPGSSAYMKGGVVAYSVAVKEQVLGVSTDIIERFGVVSEETATAMVRAAMTTMHTDCAVATTGIAGPDGGTPDTPVGTIWIAAACGDRLITQMQKTNFGRVSNVERAGNNALLMLRELLMTKK
jgi:nicotinamide-nucleotide amidase